MTRNQERAEHARQALQHHHFLNGGGPLVAADWPDEITDILTNLMHLGGTDLVNSSLVKAHEHYNVEAGCPGCRGLIGDLDELCDTCQVDPRCVRGGGA